jgi:hypothetical protein
VRRTVGALAVALALAACSTPPDTADTVGPAPDATPPASNELAPVLTLGLPCDELPPDDGSLLPFADRTTDCAVIGSAETVGLARAEAVQGGATGVDWVVEVEVAQEDRATANALINACADREATCPTTQMAIVVEGTIISAPTVNGRDLADQEFLINGGGPAGYTQDEAEALVEQISR